MKNQKWALSTDSGCRRILAICLVTILMASFAAHLLSTDFGAVKNERITFDSRGAAVDAELYYPVGTSDEDQLPAVIVTHGAGCTFGVTRGIAQELARRGFVVLNVSAYGSGLSEFPPNDEIGMGDKTYNARETPGGMLDALNFLRTLNFVDQTRIGMTGHSQGSRRTSYAAALDCGYLTLNDILINILCDSFQQTFTEEEILQAADDLAVLRLSSDQLAHYQTLRDVAYQNFETRLRAELLIGGDGVLISPLRTVTVAGHEVQRNCQVNLGFVIGNYDTGYIDYVSRETTMQSYYTDTPLIPENWYVIDDSGMNSTSLGSIFATDITTNIQLQNAVANRQSRIISFNPETHGRNFFSSATATDVVKYFEQTLSYNRGELTDPSTKALDASNIIYIWREMLNSVAMWAMLFMVIPLASLLSRRRFFVPCTAQAETAGASGFDKKKWWIFGAVTAILGFCAIFYTNSLFAPGLPYIPFLPLFMNWWMTVIYLGIMAVGAIVLLILFRVLDKREGKPSFLNTLHMKIGVVNVLKTFLLSVILLAVAYGTLSIIVYLFNEDFRIWVAIFTEMKVEYWIILLQYTVVLFPMLLPISALTNYTIRKDVPEWMDTLCTVAFSSIGVWLCWFINYLVLHAGGTAICNWNSSYAMLMLVPFTAYLMRKMYKISGSIWLGAATNALFISWTMVSSIGYNGYMPQSIVSTFFNL